MTCQLIIDAPRRPVFAAVSIIPKTCSWSRSLTLAVHLPLCYTQGQFEIHNALSIHRARQLLLGRRGCTSGWEWARWDRKRQQQIPMENGRIAVSETRSSNRTEVVFRSGWLISIKDVLAKGKISSGQLYGPNRTRYIDMHKFTSIYFAV